MNIGDVIIFCIFIGLPFSAILFGAAVCFPLPTYKIEKTINGKYTLKSLTFLGFWVETEQGRIPGDGWTYTVTWGFYENTHEEAEAIRQQLINRNWFTRLCNN